MKLKDAAKASHVNIHRDKVIASDGFEISGVDEQVSMVISYNDEKNFC